MCMPSKCNTCQKNTWWGCGSHIPSVMDPVPESDRCTCSPKVNADGGPVLPD
ncbi:hypothetical protein KXX22_001555 [Aspergillus fumigatus]|nr:hypothetical protein KXX22_001555 [Aspergillus fumigatus]